MVKPSRDIEKLTPKEQKYLQSLILGYRMLTIASNQSGVPTRTLHNIARIGHGSTTYVEMLRNTLLSGINSPKIENITENRNARA